MNKKSFRYRLNRLYQYRSKLKYELITNGEKMDSVLFRSLLHNSKNLKYARWSNKDFIYVNPLGVKSFLK